MLLVETSLLFTSPSIEEIRRSITDFRVKKPSPSKYILKVKIRLKNAVFFKKYKKAALI